MSWDNIYQDIHNNKSNKNTCQQYYRKLQSVTGHCCISPLVLTLWAGQIPMWSLSCVCNRRNPSGPNADSWGAP